MDHLHAAVGLQAQILAARAATAAANSGSNDSSTVGGAPAAHQAANDTARNLDSMMLGASEAAAKAARQLLQQRRRGQVCGRGQSVGPGLVVMSVCRHAQHFSACLMSVICSVTAHVLRVVLLSHVMVCISISA